MKIGITRQKPLSLLLALILIIFVGSSASAEIEGYDSIAENEHLILLMDKNTTEIAIQDRETGQVWYSNPADREEVETLARGNAKAALGAQIILNYYDPEDNRRIKDNYNESIALGQFELTPLTNGVRVDYILGEQVQEEYLPVIVSKEKFEETIATMDEFDQMIISDYYLLVKLEAAKKGKDAKGVVAGYQIVAPEKDLDENDQAVLGEVLVDHYIKYRSNIKSKSDIKPKDVEPLTTETVYMLQQREQDMLAWDREDMIELFSQAGLNHQQISMEYQKYNLDPLQGNVEVFKIPLEYYLEDDSLLVRIPTSEIEYPVNVLDEFGKKTSYPLVSVEVLPFFGAAGVNDQGYIFVPDGSGALINLNNGKITANPYGQMVYGKDLGLTQPKEIQPVTKGAHIPVFGLKENTQAFFAIIEEGDAIAKIKADISGRKYSYNTVWPEFSVIAQDKAGLQASVPDARGATIQWIQKQNVINVFQQQIYAEDLKIRYTFLHEAKANYSGMAEYYRDYLVKKYGLEKIAPGTTIPFYLELVGAIHDYKPVMGVKTEVIEPLTTFDQAKRVIMELSGAGISNINLTYSGWQKRGIHHIFPTEVKPEKVLGGERDFKSLLDFLNPKKINFFLGVDFTNVYTNEAFDGFSVRRDALRYLDGKFALPQLDSIYFDPVTGAKKIGTCYILSASRLTSVTDRFLRDLSVYDVNGVYLQNIGTQLNSDFTKRNNELTREKTRDIITTQTEKFNQQGKIQARGVNAYLLPYVDNILNLPMSSSGYNIIDKDIPFYQMVLHGYIPFSGEPVNFSPDSVDIMLKLLETGGYPYFLGYYASSAAVKETCFDRLFTGSLNDWFDDALSIYYQLNSVLRDVQNQQIINHEQLADNVYRTTFENGMMIIVNYNAEPVQIGELEIAGKGYYRLEGER